MELVTDDKAAGFMELAWDEADNAKCQKSHFGAVIIKNGKAVAKGHNTPVGEPCEQCLRETAGVHKGEGSELCFAVHAEQNALMDALKRHVDIEGGVMYIGHKRDGQVMKFSGKPYCTVCSRLIAASGLKGVALYTGEGCVLLKPGEFNEESFRTILSAKGIEFPLKLVGKGANPRNI